MQRRRRFDERRGTPCPCGIRWSTAGWVELPSAVSGATSSGRGISDDGRVTVGNTGGQACRWVGNEAPELLGITGNAYAASADGRTIVGVVGNPASGGSLAFMWDEENGARPLDDVLTRLQAQLGEWSLAEARDVSDDGSVMVGWATNGENRAAWMVNLEGTR